MAHNTRPRSGRTGTALYGRRDSTPAEVDEFRRLFASDRFPDGQPRPIPAKRTPMVRCWHHPDRTASVHVTPESCVWHCHSCGRGGGLVELRAEVGVTPDDRSRFSMASDLDWLASWCEPGADPMSWLAEYPDAIDELRSRTGRHKKDRTISDNVMRLLASVHGCMVAADRTIGVRYTQLDAGRDGISAGLWQDLVAMPLAALGGRPLISLWLDVVVGESGRCARLWRGTGQGGAFRATTVSVAFLDYSTGGERRKGTTGEISPRNNPETSFLTPEVTVTASVAASVPRSDVPTLHRRRAVAMLLATLSNSSRQIDGTNIIEPADSLTISVLVGLFGDRIRRTIRAAEALGWVTVERVPGARAHGVVKLTAEGHSRLNDDHKGATWWRNDRADRVGRDWANRQKAARAALDAGSADARARAHARHVEAHRAVHDDVAPWLACGRGRVRHAVTGEIRDLVSLRY
jgi:hypothetical protein